MYILIIWYCYTGGCIRHKTNGTLQACSISIRYCVANSATGVLPDILCACSVISMTSCLLVPRSCGCVVNSVLSVMGYQKIHQ